MKFNNKKKNIKTRLQMSRGSDGLFRLSITDDASSNVIIEVKLDNGGISDLISTSYTSPQNATFFPSEVIGKQMEVTTLSFTVEKAGKKLLTGYDRKEMNLDLKKIYKHAEKIVGDGWIADECDFNSKLLNGSGKDRTYTVTLRRYL